MWVVAGAGLGVVAPQQQLGQCHPFMAAAAASDSSQPVNRTLSEHTAHQSTVRHDMALPDTGQHGTTSTALATNSAAQRTHGSVEVHVTQAAGEQQAHVHVGLVGIPALTNKGVGGSGMKGRKKARETWAVGMFGELHCRRLDSWACIDRACLLGVSHVLCRLLDELPSQHAERACAAMCIAPHSKHDQPAAAPNESRRTRCACGCQPPRRA